MVRKILLSFLLLLAFATPKQCLSQNSHDVTVTLTQMADFQITSTPDKDAHISILDLNTDTSYIDGTYRIAHNSATDKIILAQVTGGSTALGITLKALLEAPAAGSAESKGSISLLDGSAVPLGAQTLVDKVPSGDFPGLTLHYIASANISAAVGNNVFTVTFTISE